MDMVEDGSHPNTKEAGMAADRQLQQAKTCQVDRLSALPEELLSKIHGVVKAQYDNRSQLDESFRIEPDLEYQLAEEQPAYQPLRRCSKGLTAMCDKLRTSIHFQSRNQVAVQPFLEKLTNLSAVTIQYSSDEPDIHTSLASLHITLPHLSSLVLKFEPEQQDNEMIVEYMSSLLLPWSSTLRRLELTNMSCLLSHKDSSGRGSGSSGSSGSSLDFLSQLISLRVLLLKNVSPSLETKDIIRCTGLLELSLGHQSCKVDIDLDLSSFTCLQKLTLIRYSIKSLNVSGLKALLLLDCFDNNLAELDVSMCSSLEHLTCSLNPIAVLDLSACPKLQLLDCGSEALAKLCVSGCSLMRFLGCDRSLLTELDLSTCTSLQTLQCTDSDLTALDLRACAKLQCLYANDCEDLISVQLVGLTALTRVELMQSGITSLSVSGCSALHVLNCAKSKNLSSLQLSGCSTLAFLDVSRCKVQALDLTQCVHLHQLDCSLCPLEHLNLEACGELVRLDCSGTGIKLLDVTPAASSLEGLVCEQCPLKVLDLTGCCKMKAILCGGCPFEVVHFEGCQAVVKLLCKDAMSRR